MAQLADRQPELQVSARELRLVRIAGLCHDLGHGPFSHAFESWIRRAEPSFHHEKMSIEMLKYLIEDNALDYDKQDIQFVEQLITGQRPPK